MGIRRRSAFQVISSFKGAKRGMIQKNKQLSSEILRLMENNPFAGTQIKINSLEARAGTEGEEGTKIFLLC